ncbi:urea transporter [Streptomyces candidus]|uniref:Urea transporter n=1 Tax=Streptomyces candidus TaxID=67283 RepID=A0A7X0HNY2_9ACTN|nr:urea transporter [Streptomyces candidus]MBB6439643.1 urea transporter [Streptomyces candidus]GHH56274.1 urea transporter [Streptomyces candidus]
MNHPILNRRRPATRRSQQRIGDDQRITGAAGTAGMRAAASMAANRTPAKAGSARSGLRSDDLRTHFLTVLRGVAQVFFLPSAMAGALFAGALFIGDWRLGFYGMGGAAVAGATAHLLGLDADRTRRGLEGVNGCLVAIGLAAALGPEHRSTMVVTLMGSAMVVIVTNALAQVLGTWGLPPLTAPFCTVVGVVVAAAPGLPWLQRQGLPVSPQPASTATVLTWGDLAQGFLANISQVVFMPQWYIGLLLLIGILAADRLAGVMACVGSLTALVVAATTGIPATAVRQGLTGYNAVLVAMALGAVFLTPGRRSALYGTAGAAVATVLAVACGRLFPAQVLTWPFVLTTMVFLAAAPMCHHLTPRHLLPSSGPTPEGTGHTAEGWARKPGD